MLESLQPILRHKLNNYRYKKIKEGMMSNEEAEQLMETFDKWDAKHAKHNFINRMERKLNRKERSART